MKFRFNVLHMRVVDGDSVEFTLDQGFGNSKTHIFRFKGLDADEGKKTDAAYWLREQLDCSPKLIEVETYKADKYGRYLCEVFKQVSGGWQSLNQELLALGLATPYSGGKRT